MNPEAVAAPPAPAGTGTASNHPPALHTGGAVAGSTAPMVENTLSDPKEPFERLLAGNEFEAAVDWYERIYTNHDLDVSTPYRDDLLDHVSRLNQEGRYEHASALLGAYLAIFHTDVEALILQARVFRNAGLYLDAIESFQQARVNEHRPHVSSLILTQANTLIGEYVQSLRESNDPQAVTELYQWLTRSHPTVPGYHIGLANAYAAQQRYPEAVGALQYVQHDPSVGGKARSLIIRYSSMSSGTEKS